MSDYIDIQDITPGESYACKFRVETLVDDLGRPAPNLSDQPLAGTKVYEGIGLLVQRDLEQRLVKLQDEASQKTFIVSFDDIWDIDTVEWN
jgi:hypothetical protein